ncbi:hypothetical protein IFM89_037391 [Coptis chinensis]|uniref:DNA mismatch repair protein MSH3 n=1 Tax=Coptis chinensis TaxID=261450 RepID=A0A835II26_9MAGN|nr:hypothetical protein IFM89_037391 [Coptis chinensis]
MSPQSRIETKGIGVDDKECGVEGGFDVRIGFVAVEISTGDVVYGEFNDNVMRMALEGVVLSLSPAEVLLGEPLSKQTEKMLLSYAGPTSSVRVERASRDCFKDGGALAEVTRLYENMGGDSSIYAQEHDIDNTAWDKHLLGVEGIMTIPGLAVQALALIMRHLKQFGFERIMCLGATLRPFYSNMEMTLSANALQQLEVLRNNSDGSETGSFACNESHPHYIWFHGFLNTGYEVTHPLCDRTSISARLDAVSEIAESMTPSTKQNGGGVDNEDECVAHVKPLINDVLCSVLTTLGRSTDIQRGITRIFHRTATASEVYEFRNLLELIRLGYQFHLSVQFCDVAAWCSIHYGQPPQDISVYLAFALSSDSFFVSMLQFIAVVCAILYAGKQLQQLQVDHEDSNEELQEKTVHSALLRRLLLTASSPTVVNHAAKLLSLLNKDAADQKDLQNLFITSDGQFPEVARAQTTVEVASHKLDSLISMYREAAWVRNLDFISVSGSTHLIEVIRRTF